MIQRTLATTITATWLACGSGTARSEQDVKVDLARQGHALHTVVIGPQASQTSRTAAEELADYLGRISGAKFTLEQGDGTAGLAVGAFDEFPVLKLDAGFAPSDPFRREQYLLRSHARGLHLIGATPAAARLAVWDLLYRLGHRQFLPTDHWEIVPSRPDLAVAVDGTNKPDYHSRRIYPGGPRWDYAEPMWERWCIRNRNDSSESFNLSTSHAYGAIISSNASAFEKHPDYFALVKGERKSLGGNTKFCIGNKDLRKLVVDHNVRIIRADPARQSVSLDPSDGGNWCENCQACERMGTVSDRVTTLANEVAEAINALGLGDKYVGMYAYAEHSTPPHVQVHPKVVVSVATDFIRGGYTAEELVARWAAKGAIIGLREYYSISTWHGDRPNRARASDLPYLARTVRHFHEKGARFNRANVSHSWGGYGLGFYLLAQMLWDVEQTGRVDELFDDFLERGFGPARQPIEKYHRLIYRFDKGDVRMQLSPHLIGLMYRHLARARELADGGDAGLIARIDDLILYTRYVDLFYRTASAGGSDRQKLGEELLRHIHAIRRSMLVIYHKGDKRRLPDFKSPEGEALAGVQSIDAYTPGQIKQMLAEGIAGNELMDFEAVTFSDDLIPAAEALRFPALPAGTLGTGARRTQTYYTWLDKPGTITLRVRGGLIPHYRNRGNVRITVHSPMDEVGDGVAFDDSVPPDGEERTVKLVSPFPGLHRIVATDGGDSTLLGWADDSQPCTVPVEQGATFTHRGRLLLYFYVPRGTRTVGGFSEDRDGAMRDGDGNAVFAFSGMKGPGYFNVAVPRGQDGRIWRMEGISGARNLMTVPPYMAISPQHLLVPREVVEKDRRR